MSVDVNFIRVIKYDSVNVKIIKLQWNKIKYTTNLSTCKYFLERQTY